MLSPTPYDINFPFCGFPVRVHPLFWVVAVLLGIGGSIDDLPVWLVNLTIWVAAVFVSVLLHELGYAAAFRYVLRVPAYIVLYFGGVTIPLYPVLLNQRSNLRRFFKEASVAVAGPFAGFVLAGFIMLFLLTVGVSLDDAVGLPGFHPKVITLTFLWDLFWISVIWEIFNLFPIYPMDGGHIAREVCCLLSPRSGVRYSLIFSMTVSVFLLLLSLRYGSMHTAVLMGYFAYQNYRELTFHSFRRW